MAKRTATDAGPVGDPGDSSAIRKIDPDLVEQVHSLNKFENVASTIRRQAETELRQHLARKSVFLVALHGSSKQGKTTILRSIFSPSTAIGVELGYDPTREIIYNNLLGKAGTRVPAEQTKKLTWRLKFFGLPIGVGTDFGEEVMHVLPRGEPIDIDWVAETLKKSTKIRTIVIDNFHHVSEETQKALARDFPSLGAKGFKIIIAGTWKQNDYLVTHNTDLSEFYRSISIDPWTVEELASVVLTGATALSYAIPERTAGFLATAAQGSIWALQTITARFYTDQIARRPEYENANNDGSRTNLAAQRVAAAKVSELATMLVRISDWGATDGTGRSQVSYIVDAFLHATPHQMNNGFTERQLKQAVDDLTRAWAKTAHRSATLMSPADFAKKLKHDWMKHQIQEHNTPVIVHNPDLKLVTVNDSVLVFVHRTKASSLLKAFHEQLKARADR